MRHAPKRRRGMAILVVMVIVVLVALAAYGFNQQMIEAYRRSTWDIEQAQAENASRSGIEYGLAWMQQTRAERLGARAGNAIPMVVDLGGSVDLGSGSERGGSTASGSEGELGWAFALISPASSNASFETIQGDTLPGWQLGLVNESAKLNVHQLRKWNVSNPGYAKQILMQLPGADASTVDRWLENQGIRSGGSQVGGKRSLRERMEEKIAESSGINVDPQRQWARLWMGGDWDWNYAVDSMEEAINKRLTQNPAGVETPVETMGETRGSRAEVIAWRDYLTFHSGQRNVNRHGQSRVFLNTSDLQTLHRELRSLWTEEAADFVVAVRQYGFIKKAVGSSEPVPPPIPGPGNSGSSEWTPDFNRPATVMLRSPLDLVGATVDVTTGDGKTLTLQSPFPGDVQGMGNYLESLVDDVTVDPNAMIIGQVDVSEAPVEVLAAIPGIQSADIEKIVESRSGESDVSSDRKTVAWLVTEQCLTWDRFVALYPWITVGGDCYSGQVVGFRDDRSPVVRYTMVFDCRTGEASVRDVQSWHGWGKGFSVEQLRSLDK